MDRERVAMRFLPSQMRQAQIQKASPLTQRNLSKDQSLWRQLLANTRF